MTLGHTRPRLSFNIGEPDRWSQTEDLLQQTPVGSIPWVCPGSCVPFCKCDPWIPALLLHGRGARSSSAGEARCKVKLVSLARGLQCLLASLRMRKGPCSYQTGSEMTKTIVFCSFLILTCWTGKHHTYRPQEKTEKKRTLNTPISYNFPISSGWMEMYEKNLSWKAFSRSKLLKHSNIKSFKKKN